MFFFFHGFRGKSPNKFTRALEKYFPEENVFGLTYTFNPIEVEKSLTEEIRERIGEHLDDINIAFVGHSLGGFWAYYFAHKHPTSKAILINPLLDPWVLAPKAGTYYSYHGPITITEQEILDYKKYSMFESHDTKVPTVLLFDQNDTKIDPEHTKALLAKKDVNVFTFKGGNHRFTHLKQAMPTIEWFYNKNRT